jgi:hypothetical protein
MDENSIPEGEIQAGRTMTKIAVGVRAARESMLVSALSIIMGFLFLLMFCPYIALASEGVDISTEGMGAVSLPASVDGGPGKYSMVRAGATGTVKTEYVTLKLSARRDMYSWFDRHRLPFGNGRDVPWEALNRLGLSLKHSGELGGEWGYFASADASASYEKQIDGSLGVSATAGVVWKPSQEWTVRLGAGVVWHRIQSYPIPVVGIEYRSQTVKGLDAALGFPYSHVGYRVNEWLGVRLTGEMDYGLYRLASDSGVRRDGYVEFAGYSAGLWAELTPVEAMTLRLGCAWDFQGSVTLYRENGEGKKQYSREGTPRISASMRYDF